MGIKYNGWLENNGQQAALFDSNVNDKDRVSKFKVGERKVIRGWEEGIQGMKKGGKRIIVVPSEMGYGASGLSPSIPPNSNLIYEVSYIIIL